MAEEAAPVPVLKSTCECGSGGEGGSGQNSLHPVEETVVVVGAVARVATLHDWQRHDESGPGNRQASWHTQLYSCLWDAECVHAWR